MLQTSSGSPQVGSGQVLWTLTRSMAHCHTPAHNRCAHMCTHTTQTHTKHTWEWARAFLSNSPLQHNLGGLRVRPDNLQNFPLGSLYHCVLMHQEAKTAPHHFIFIHLKLFQKPHSQFCSSNHSTAQKLKVCIALISFWMKNCTKDYMWNTSFHTINTIKIWP